MRNPLQMFLFFFNYFLKKETGSKLFREWLLTQLPHLKCIVYHETSPRLMVFGWAPCVEVTSHLKCNRLVYVRSSLPILMDVGSNATPNYLTVFPYNMLSYNIR